MSHRLQVLIPTELNAQLTKVAQRRRVSKGEWVRQVLEQAVRAPGKGLDPVARLAAMNEPTGDIEQMLAEIDRGRR